MTRIKTTCPTCGEVELKPDMIRIVPERDAYVFHCTGGCERLVSKQADDRILNLLESAGVEISEPPKHPESATVYQKITNDDLIDFHENIDGELDKLLGRDDGIH
jgi:hypothetical protein